MAKFSNAVVGDQVTSKKHGYGTIILVDHEEHYPIRVEYSGYGKVTYTKKGKEFMDKQAQKGGDKIVPFVPTADEVVKQFSDNPAPTIVLGWVDEDALNDLGIGISIIVHADDCLPGMRAVRIEKA